MNFSNLLQDPMVVLELIAIASTLLIIAKFIAVDLNTESPKEFEYMYGNKKIASKSAGLKASERSDKQVIVSSNYFRNLFTVGSLISLPKQCLTHQSF